MKYDKPPAILSPYRAVRMYTHSRAAKLNHTPMTNTPNKQERPKSTIVLDVEAPSAAGLRDVVCRVQALTELLEVINNISASPSLLVSSFDLQPP